MPLEVPTHSSLSEKSREMLARRLGQEHFEKRLQKQSGIQARRTHQGRGIFFFERFIPMDECIHFLLRATGMYARGRRNFLDVRLVTHEVRSEKIPSAFDGFRLLQVCDLHADLDTALTDVVIERIRSVEYDFAVFTGDYHNKIGKCHRRSLDEMKKILPVVAGRCCGIMGNHDFLEKVPFLEDCGLPILLNEHHLLKRGDVSLALCGIDDPQFFGTHDLAAAKAGIPDTVFKILLSHGPEPYREAAAMGYDLFLCGHTHGGQMCLPGGIPVIRNSRCPLPLLSGAWKHQGMQGYTSRGTGGCGVPARFNCPPEITLHILRCEK